MEDAMERSTLADKLVAARLKAARSLKGLSQVEMGKRLGITYQQWQKYEQGRNRMSCGRIPEVAKVLGQPIGWFFQDLDERTPNQTITFMSAPGAGQLISFYLSLSDADRLALIRIASALTNAPSSNTLEPRRSRGKSA
jgi:transcriptional regulator with XRE-family HTH domain